LVRKARSMGLTVLSGGAYGVDAQAHRQALISPGEGLPTIAILAGGLDRLYPAGNVELLRQIGVDGLLVTEMPPGMRPNRYRFLNRNRLIAALSSTSIVIEARYRSGALSTANHAHDLGRTVGAVPGPINVPSSAGCHRLLKETPALLIDDPGDLENLYGLSSSNSDALRTAEHQRDYDMLNVEEMLVFDALPVRTRTDIGHLTGLTGLSVPQITGALSKLERHELAEQNVRGWRKHRDTIL
ncbi:MAG TPA: DNA-processing protein DprA, partial [Enteractinococcus sp.]